MIAVRQGTIRVLPRRTRRMLKSIAPKADKAPRRERTGLFESFEKMLDNQVQLMFRELER